MIRTLTYLGDPILRAQAAPIAVPDSADIITLARNMVETMVAGHGVGLAAPQIGIGQRLIVFCVPDSRVEAADAVPLQILINPSLTPLGDEHVMGLEGCLSLPGLRGMVPRYQRIGYSGYDLAGNWIEREAEGFHARVVQHEIDHLDGVMYLDRMADMSTLVHESVLRRRIEQETDNVQKTPS